MTLPLPVRHQGPHGKPDNSRDYSPAELEFLRAIQQWKRAHRGRPPGPADVLALVWGLGWRKRGEEGAPSPAAVELFSRALAAYKRRRQRPFPSWMEVLQVLHHAGWRWKDGAR
jgi:hypothetical protein